MQYDKRCYLHRALPLILALRHNSIKRRVICVVILKCEDGEDRDAESIVE